MSDGSPKTDSTRDFLDQRLSQVVGRWASTLTKGFGMETVEDLLRHYPRGYVDSQDLSDVSRLQPNDLVTLIGQVEAATVRAPRRGSTWRVEVVVSADNGRTFEVTFFARRKGQADWRAGSLRAGTRALFSGRVTYFNGRLQLSHPDYEVIADEDDDAAARDRVRHLIPIYRITGKITSWQIAGAVRTALDVLGDPPDPLPEEVRERHDLMGLAEALHNVHLPETQQDWQAARRRLKFEEAFVLQALLAERRAARSRLPAVSRPGRPDGVLERFDAALPFRLTEAQVEVGDRLSAELSQPHPMHRLLQGEVGSGKTVVALRAMLQVVDSGGQAALLAPTEVLAQQHHRSITALLGDLAQAGMLGGAEEGTQVALLTGSQGGAARKAALLDAASGTAGIVVGTHALLQERVQFADLGLVVVDEQHRFGVEQRAALTEKSGEQQPPHLLVMTATPIPRTVAMTVFGDLEVSTIRQLPSGRAPVQTTVVPVAEQPQWLDRAWERIREEVGRGRQAYVVCARIGDEGAGEDDEPRPPGADDRDADENDRERRPLAGVLAVADELRNGPLSGLRLDVLHGRLPPDVKDGVMRRFADGEVDVLVATTVIEVGVDVPNASVMVVLDADRFGVSQLHQLRGRIGRGSEPGLCLLVTADEQGSPARERLDAVAATADGFELSRVDLRLRREGDVLGSAQSGRSRHLRLLSVLRDEDLIVAAREAAAAVVTADPALAEHPALAGAVRALAATEQAEFLERT